ncbi:hypothetical protein E2C01_099976 [Portunus trituberculatus]|uniref:Uncharacterized protein n=1 Tax=Portunus trituberculatus TaxID=210409 RepID=A0A5B7KCB4_PORTR|nr:hypothetical protein [Portunus trituberculatus]
MHPNTLTSLGTYHFPHSIRQLHTDPGHISGFADSEMRKYMKQTHGRITDTKNTDNFNHASFLSAASHTPYTALYNIDITNTLLHGHK